MRRLAHGIPFAAGLALLAGATACSKDAASTAAGPGAGPSGAIKAPLSVNLASTSSSSSAGANVYTGIMEGGFFGNGGFGDFGDGDGHHWRGWWGWTRTRDVDSLIVTVTKLEVLTAFADSENAADSMADSVKADSVTADSDRGRDWGEREWGWTSLPIDSAHLDLIHLPDSAAAGIKIATGKLPAGTYRHVRLFIINPTIYFDSTIVAPNGDTLKAHTGYPVTFPNADSTGATFRTDDPFTVAAVGDTVPLFFDRDDTVRHIIITGDGKIVVLPSFHQGHDRH